MTVSEREAVFVVLYIDGSCIAPVVEIALGITPEADIGRILIGDLSVGLDKSARHFAFRRLCCLPCGDRQCGSAENRRLHHEGLSHFLQVAALQLDAPLDIVFGSSIALHVEGESDICRILGLVDREVAVEVGTIDLEAIGALHIGLLLFIPRALTIALRSALHDEIEHLGLGRYSIGSRTLGISKVHLAIVTATIFLDRYETIGDGLIATHLIISRGIAYYLEVAINLITRIGIG